MSPYKTKCWGLYFGPYKPDMSLKKKKRKKKEAHTQGVTFDASINQIHRHGHHNYVAATKFTTTTANITTVDTTINTNMAVDMVGEDLAGSENATA